jgi:hypothetical protein
VAEFFIIGERFVVITRQLQAAAVLSKLSTMNDKPLRFDSHCIGSRKTTYLWKCNAVKIYEVFGIRKPKCAYVFTLVRDIIYISVTISQPLRNN